MNEILGSLVRIFPFIAILIGIKIGIGRQKITTQELFIQPPPSKTKFILVLSGFLCYILITEFFLFKFGLIATSKWHHTLFPSIIRILGMVILAPIAEESLFRGVLLNKLISLKLNKHMTIIVLACFFVVVHSFAYEGTLSSKIGIAQTFIDASLYAYARFYTCSIYTPITMHATGNLIATLEKFI